MIENVFRQFLRSRIVRDDVVQVTMIEGFVEPLSDDRQLTVISHKADVAQCRRGKHKLDNEVMTVKSATLVTDRKSFQDVRCGEGELLRNREHLHCLRDDRDFF